MPYNDEQIHFMSMDHPLRKVLRQMAANGQRPSAADLATIPGYAASPLARERITAAVDEAVRLHRSGQHAAAERAADDATQAIGPTLARHAMPEDPRPTESLTDLGARMFRH